MHVHFLARSGDTGTKGGVDVAIATGPRGMASPTDPRLLSTKDYLSVTFFRAIRCSLVLVPWSFGTIALNEGLYSIITVKPR